MKTEENQDDEGGSKRAAAERALASDPVWRAALARAVTGAALEEARTFARMLLASGADAYTDETPAELAHEAMAETAMGRGQWDPKRGALGAFLCQRVKQLLWLRAREAARTVRLDLVGDDHPQAAALERALSHAPGTEHYVATRAQAAAIVDAVRDLCADDRDVLAYLDARLAGHERQADIATAMGTSIAATRAAHRRVVRCVRTLPVNIRNEVVALLA